MITVLFVILSSYLAAQNWSPILVNEKMNYQHSDSTYISHSIWVDSVETNGDNMIYHLNRIVKDVPGNPEIVLRNQPQFLLKQMTDQNLGYYVFSYPGEIVIKSLAGIGDGWVFNQQSFILAEVSSVAQEDVFGVQDSVKVIHLTDGNEIRLSKNFGILNFPDFDNGGYYELVGIQNSEYGESVPDFWDIFDFEVGDVFQRKYYYEEPDFEVDTIEKITINGYEITNESVTIAYSRIYKVTMVNFGQIGYQYGISNEEKTYYYSMEYLTNSFQSQLVKLEDVFIFINLDVFPAYAKTEIYKSPYDLTLKHFGNNEVLYYSLDPNSDSLYSYHVGFGDASGFLEYIYGESLGFIYTIETPTLEIEHYFYLQGYVKNDDTVGIITPDYELMTSINNESAKNPSGIVFPNPANKKVNLKFPSNGYNTNCTIEIMNLLGEVSIKEEVNGIEILTLDIGNLKRGIYFYSIKENGLVIQKDKLIIQ